MSAVRERTPAVPHGNAMTVDTASIIAGTVLPGRRIPPLELPPVVGGRFECGLHRHLCHARRRTYELAHDDPARGGD